jgi:hypothetical protein
MPRHARGGPRSALAALVLAALPALGPAVALAASPSPVASPTAASTPDPYAGQPWWVPAALGGRRLTAVSESGGVIRVTTAEGGALESADGGATFSAAATPPATGAADVHSGTDEWLIRAGTVLHATGGGSPAPDPAAPDLGAGAHLIAAPVSEPGVVVAVSDAGVVWRRTVTGDWGRALVLLPRSVIGGTPAITDLTAFTAAPPGGGAPVSVYLATDGYAVLATQNGGDDWFRDGPGLPDSVLGLAAAPELSAVFAATDDGLWVHHLRVLPGVPQYPAPDLTARQRWILGITVATCLAGGALLALLLRVRPGHAGGAGARA